MTSKAWMISISRVTLSMVLAAATTARAEEAGTGAELSRPQEPAQGGSAASAKNSSDAAPPALAAGPTAQPALRADQPSPSATIDTGTPGTSTAPDDPTVTLTLTVRSSRVSAIMAAWQGTTQGASLENEVAALRAEISRVKTRLATFQAQQKTQQSVVERRLDQQLEILKGAIEDFGNYVMHQQCAESSSSMAAGDSSTPPADSCSDTTAIPITRS